jgi:protocatechuate 3,4-dioxygenase beta subunit
MNTLILLFTLAVATMAGPNEPGTRLVVSGTVYDKTGTKPVPGLTLYAYHTDARGLYNERRENNNPRLKAHVKTDAQGRFELRTIRPASYPGGGNPAHIHFEVVGGAGQPKQWVDSLHFSDDPYVTPKMREESRAKGRFATVLTPQRDRNGVLHVTMRMRLRQ